MGNKSSKSKSAAKNQSKSEDPKVTVVAPLDERIERREVNFLEYHEFTPFQRDAAIQALSQCNVPESISRFIIDFLYNKYYRAYCKIVLSFVPSAETAFANFRVPHWIQQFEAKQRATGWMRFSVPAYSMIPKLYPCQGLDDWKFGSAWWQQWGRNLELDADWKLHSYIDTDTICAHKATPPPQDQLVKFMLVPHIYADASYVCRRDLDEFRYNARCAILCVDYHYKYSLKNAEKFAADIISSGRARSNDNFLALFIAVVNCNITGKEDDDEEETAAETPPFTWEDVCDLGKKLDASCFELSSEIDDNLMFMYNQIVYEYTYCLAFK